MKYYSLLLIGVLLLTACGNNSSHSLQKEIELFSANPVVLPTFENDENGNPECRMIVWYDSTVCGACELKHVFQWDEMILFSEHTGEKFDIKFIFSPKAEDVHSVKQAIKSYKMTEMAYLDTNGEFERLNPNLPKTAQLHTFLLDKQNHVILVGSPIRNDSLWELYKEQIRLLLKG